MAALDLQRGMWVGERPEFDSEMLEWEEQLQDMQRKIEELYSEVVARRGGNDGAQPNQPSDITLLPVANKDSGRYNNGRCQGNSSGERPVGMSLPTSLSKGCGYQLNNGYGYSNSYPGNAGMDPTLEILQGYLGHGKSQQNSSAANPKQTNGFYPVAHRNTSGWPKGRSEEFENQRNQSVYYESPQGVDYYDPHVTPAARMPVRHQDNFPPGHPPQQRPSPPDRKPAPLDRKQGSPSVLRKFGAMLQENEGKLLTDTGVVAPSPPPSVVAPTASSPVSPRRSHTRTPSHTHTHTHTQAHTRYSNPSPTPPPHSSPKLPPTHGHQRGGLLGGERRDRDVPGARVPVQGADLAGDYWMVEHNLNGPSVSRRRSNSSGSGGSYSNGGYYGNGAGVCRQESGLVDLLNMLDIQQHHQNQQPQRPASRVTHTPPVSHESSPAPMRRSFSRPARPANQRPPSRWAGQTGHTRPKVPSHSGPMSRPPSPARKARPANQSFSSYSLHTETVIM